MFSIKENVEMEIKNGKCRLVGFVDIRRLHKDMTKLEGKYSGLSSFKVLCPSPLIQVLSQSLLYDYISQLHYVTHRLTCCRVGINTQV